MMAILTASIATVILLGSAATLAEEAAPQRRAELTTTRIFFGPSEDACVEPQRRHESLLAEVALLVGRAVLPPLVGAGAQKAADYFDQLSTASSSKPVIISRGGHLYRLDAADQVLPNVSCVSIVRGRFNRAPTPSPAANDTAPGPVERYGVVERFGLAEPPELLVELDFEVTPEGGSARLTPNLVYFRQSAATDKGTGSKTLGLTLRIEVISPEGNQATEVLLPIQILNVPIGTWADRAMLEWNDGWAPLPMPSEELVSTVAGVRESLEEDQLPFYPATFRFTFEEIDQPDPYFTAMAGVFRFIAGPAEEIARKLPTGAQLPR